MEYTFVVDSLWIGIRRIHPHICEQRWTFQATNTLVTLVRMFSNVLGVLWLYGHDRTLQCPVVRRGL